MRSLWSLPENRKGPSEALSDVMLLDLYLRENLKEQAILCFRPKPYEQATSGITGKREKNPENRPYQGMFRMEKLLFG